MEEPYSSMKELNKPSLSIFKGGDRSKCHSICMRRIVGKEHALVKHVLYYDCMHYFTMFMEAMAPRKSIISCKIHGQYWALKISEFGHSLDD